MESQTESANFGMEKSGIGNFQLFYDRWEKIEVLPCYLSSLCLLVLSV